MLNRELLDWLIKLIYLPNKFSMDILKKFSILDCISSIWINMNLWRRNTI